MTHLVETCLTIFLTAVLLRLSWLDINTLRLPDSYTLTLIIVGVGLPWLIPGPDLLARLMGATAGFASLGLIGEIHFRRTKVEGLGLGDAKLFAAAGAWLGWQALPVVVLIGSMSGLVYAIIFRRGRLQEGIAFGPMLALGFLLSWLWRLT